MTHRDNFCVGGCGRRDAFWFMEGRDPTGPYCPPCWIANAPDEESRAKGRARFAVAALLGRINSDVWPRHWFKKETR